MRILKKLFILGCIWGFAACHHKGGDQTAETKIEPAEFVAMFHELALPVNFADSSLPRKTTDSPINWSIFTQFISDSVIQNNFGKTVKPKLFAAGKLKVKKAETYLFIKAITPAKKILYVVCLDKDDVFKTAMPVVIRDGDADSKYTTTIDNKYAISITRQRKDNDSKMFFVRTVYIYNSEGVFMLIMRESNEGKSKTAQIYNPIDTLSHKHKFTGDYLQDKRNFISFRDGKNNGVLRFFVHFEKDEGTCKGELKGEVKLVGPSTARYAANGDPCSLEFNFTDKTVRMKELEGCGNHRDIRCYFEGLYNKHKEAVVKSEKSRKRVK